MRRRRLSPRKRWQRAEREWVRQIVKKGRAYLRGVMLDSIRSVRTVDLQATITI